jgi:hypothetical protein
VPDRQNRQCHLWHLDFYSLFDYFVKAIKHSIGVRLAAGGSVSSLVIVHHDRACTVQRLSLAFLFRYPWVGDRDPSGHWNRKNRPRFFFQSPSLVALLRALKFPSREPPPEIFSRLGSQTLNLTSSVCRPGGTIGLGNREGCRLD